MPHSGCSALHGVNNDLKIIIFACKQDVDLSYEKFLKIMLDIHAPVTKLLKSQRKEKPSKILA